MGECLHVILLTTISAPIKTTPKHLEHSVSINFSFLLQLFSHKSLQQRSFVQNKITDVDKLSDTSLELKVSKKKYVLDVLLS